MRETFIPVEPNRTYSITWLLSNIFDAIYQSRYRMKFSTQRPTVGVTGAGVGVDSAWEQRKLEARKMLEKAAESPASSARFVSRLY
jgi:hypothetical protein